MPRTVVASRRGRAPARLGRLNVSVNQFSREVSLPVDLESFKTSDRREITDIKNVLISVKERG